MSRSAGSAAPRGALPAPGTHRIDPASSTVRLHVTHLFGLGTVHGTVDLVDGEMVVADPVESSTVRATVDTGSFASGNRRRDRDVTGPDLLDSATHPRARFTGRAVRPDGADWLVHGELEAHGITRDVTLRIDRVEVADGVTRLHATARLDRTDFGITKKRGMVGRTADVELDLVAERAPL
ncbi:YceI family protein [Geodermatophilus sp. SYSU D00758]